jgi:hypothetical protein
MGFGCRSPPTAPCTAASAALRLPALNVVPEGRAFFRSFVAAVMSRILSSEKRTTNKNAQSERQGVDRKTGANKYKL